MILTLLWACSSTFDKYAVLAGCEAVTTTADGTVITETYDNFGWPTLIVVDRNDVVVETTVEYERVAGIVRTARKTTGDVVVLETYDGRGYLTDAITNLAGVEDIACDNDYVGDDIVKSVCNDVETNYDPCGNPLEVITPTFAEAYTNTYAGCQPQGTTVEGIDARGEYNRNVQYDGAGRYIGETMARDGRTSSTLVEWTCPPQ